MPNVPVCRPLQVAPRDSQLSSISRISRPATRGCGVVVFVDRMVGADTDVHHGRKRVDPVDQSPDCIGKVACKHEFAPGGAVAPDFHRRAGLALCLVDLADDGRNQMRHGGIELVVKAVKIAGNEGAVVMAGRAAADMIVQAGNRDLGEGIAFVRRFKRAGQDLLFAQRVGGLTRVHARGAEVQKPRHPFFMGCKHDIAAHV